MATLAEVRTQHPEYADLSDQQLADGLYKKFYSDMPRDQFDAKVGLKSNAAVPPPGLVPGSREYANWAGEQARAGQALPMVSAAPPAPMAQPQAPVDMTGTPAAPVLLRDKFHGAQPVAPADQPMPNDPLASPLPGVLGQAANTFNAASAGGIDSSLLNMGSEIYAGGMAIPKAILDATQGKGFDVPRAFGDELALSEKTAAMQRGLNPGAYDVGSNLGTIATIGKAPASALAKTFLTAAGKKGIVKRAAGTSAAVGFTSGFGQPGTLPERLAHGAESGATAAVVGATVGKAATLLDGSVAPPKVQKLFDDARVFFKSAEKSQAVTAASVGQQYATDLRTFLAARGKITPSGKIAAYPDVVHAVQLADDFAQRPMTFAQWQTLRENVADAAGSMVKKERELGVKMLRMLDDHVTSLPNGAFIHGNGQQAISDWTQGRALWHIAEKGKTVEGLIGAAQRQSRKSAAVPVEQALRNKFDTFVSKEKNLRGFTPAEQAALRKVGDGTTTGNIAKGLGRLAPTTLASVFYKAAGPAYVANMFGGPVAATVGIGSSLGLGVVGKIISKISTKNQVELARLLVLNGGKVPQAIPSAASAEVKRALGNLMILGSSKAGNMNQAVTSGVSDWLASLNAQPAAQ